MKRLFEKVKKFIHYAVSASFLSISCQNMALGMPGPLGTGPEIWTNSEVKSLIRVPLQADGTHKRLHQRHPWRTVGIVTLSVGAVVAGSSLLYVLYPVIAGVVAYLTSPSVPTETSPQIGNQEWESMALQCPFGMQEIGRGVSCRKTWDTYNWCDPLSNRKNVAICSDGQWLNCANLASVFQGCPSGTHPGNAYAGKHSNIFRNCELENSSIILPDRKGAVVCVDNGWVLCDKDLPKPAPEPTTTTTPKPAPEPTTTTTPKPKPKPQTPCPVDMEEIGRGSSCNPWLGARRHNELQINIETEAVCSHGIWIGCATSEGIFQGCPPGTYPGNVYDGTFQPIFKSCELENASVLLSTRLGTRIVCLNKGWVWCDKDLPKPNPTPDPENFIPPQVPTGAIYCPSWCSQEGQHCGRDNAVCPVGMQDGGILRGTDGQTISCSPCSPGFYKVNGYIMGCGSDQLWHACHSTG